MSETDRYLTRLMEHVVAAAPEPPDWPGEPVMSLAPTPQRAPRRSVVVAAAFVVIGVLVGVSTLVLRGGGDELAGPGLPVVIETADGVTLHGEVWNGSPVGVVVVGAYGAAANELLPIIAPLANRGFTVLTHDLRGEGRSEGEVNPDLLDEDLVDVVQFLRRWGAVEVYVAAYRHSGAAALAAAGRGALPVDGLIGLYPLGRYLEQDAVAAIGDVTIPLMLIGNTPELNDAAPAETMFRSVAPDPVIFTESGPQLAEFIYEFVRISGS